MSELAEKLKNDIDEANWDMLFDHYKREALFLVDSQLMLEDVGAAVAQDNTAAVATWLKSKMIQKIEKEHADNYEKDAKAKNFHFLIVQPYVFIKLKA